MRNIPYFLLLILFVACNKPAPRNNEITKIEFARLGAWLDFGAAISIDSSLTYNYYHSKPFADSGQYYTGKITQAYWDTINRKIEHIRYKTIDITDNAQVQDGTYYEIIITWKSGKRRIERYKNYKKKDSVLATLNWINDSYNYVNLRPIDTPIKFETTFQNPLHPPKQIKGKPIKFPPPNKN